MGLYKEIQEQNGVITNYHRIVSINIVTNINNLIEIASYTSRAKREEEINALQNKTGCDVFINTTLISTVYDQDMTIDTAYEWLKTQPMFEYAEDM